MHPNPHAEGTRVVLRAAAVGSSCVLVALVLALTALPESRLPGSARIYLVWGAAAGAVAGMLGNFILARGAFARVGPHGGTAFLRGLVLDVALQFAAVVLGVVGLFAVGVKFSELAAFGLALAGAAVLFRGAGTVLMARALDARARGQAAVPDRTSACPAPSSSPTAP
ncbi:MAG: hypothetical protein H6837_00335 [Planctomycetes bacterium]|nr:hypothetical protein [Planctomycetota bacterium]